MPRGSFALTARSNMSSARLRLGLKCDVVGNARLGAARGIVGPALGQIQLEVDGDVLLRRRDRQADADLAVRDLAGRAGVLALHADRVLALLEKAGVVDDPGPRHGRAAHRFERVARGGQPHRVVVPRRVGDELLQALMRCIHVRDARARARRDRLHALALASADQPERVAREVGASLRRPEDLAEVIQVVVQSLLGGAIDLDVHERDQITSRSRRATSAIRRTCNRSK